MARLDRLNDVDAPRLRSAFAVARQAGERGNAPFGAVLVGPDGAALGEAENTTLTERDPTGHAELNLVRDACPRLVGVNLKACTLYSSAEPCAMCSGAIFWSGIGRLVFGLSTSRILELVGGEAAGPVLRLDCREVFRRGRPPVAVVGPALEDEAVAVYQAYRT